MSCPQIESNPLQKSMSLEEISNDSFNNSNSKVRGSHLLQFTSVA